MREEGKKKEYERKKKLYPMIDVETEVEMPSASFQSKLIFQANLYTPKILLCN